MSIGVKPRLILRPLYSTGFRLLVGAFLVLAWTMFQHLFRNVSASSVYRKPCLVKRATRLGLLLLNVHKCGALPSVDPSV